MKVYVLTFGIEEPYKDNVFVAGIFQSKEKAVLAAEKENVLSRKKAKYGERWYDVDEFDLE